MDTWFSLLYLLERMSLCCQSKRRSSHLLGISCRMKNGCMRGSCRPPCIASRVQVGAQAWQRRTWEMPAHLWLCWRNLFGQAWHYRRFAAAEASPCKKHSRHSLLFCKCFDKEILTSCISLFWCWELVFFSLGKEDTQQLHHMIRQVSERYKEILAGTLSQEQEFPLSSPSHPQQKKTVDDCQCTINDGLCQDCS